MRAAFIAFRQVRQALNRLFIDLGSYLYPYFCIPNTEPVDDDSVHFASINHAPRDWEILRPPPDCPANRRTKRYRTSESAALRHTKVLPFLQSDGCNLLRSSTILELCLTANQLLRAVALQMRCYTSFHAALRSLRSSYPVFHLLGPPAIGTTGGPYYFIPS